jgi:hypothetical protein
MPVSCGGPWRLSVCSEDLAAALCVAPGSRLHSCLAEDYALHALFCGSASSHTLRRASTGARPTFSPSPSLSTPSLCLSVISDKGTTGHAARRGSLHGMRPHPP